MRARILWLSLVALTACSYRFQTNEGGVAGSSAPSGSVFVPVADNLTTKAGFEGPITSTVREALAATSGVSITESKGRADHVLLITIVRYDHIHGQSPLNAGPGQYLSADIHLWIRIRVRMMQRLNGQDDFQRELWNRTFEHEGAYVASDRLTEPTGSSSAPNINDSREKLQAKLLADQFARDIVDQTLQAF